MTASRPILRCTRDFLDVLQKQNELWIFADEVNPDLELACIQRMVFQRKGPAMLFTNVKGTRFPVATNLYGSEKRLHLAFGDIPKDFVNQLANLIQNIMPPTLAKLWPAKGLVRQALKIGTRKRRQGPLLKNKIEPVDLTSLPQIKSWEKDGGAFITLPLVYTESPSTGKGNLGMYRIQLFNQTQAGMHIQINRGGGFHYHEAETENGLLPACIFVGGPPALTIAAIAPLPEDIPELLFASLLMGDKIDVLKTRKIGHKLLLEADFAIVGAIPPHQRKPEGPFGDHYGYYSLRHDYPFLNVESIYHRDNAIFPATIVGRPPQEDHYIAEYLQEILEPLFPLVLKNVNKIWAYEESGVHSLTAAIVKNRYYKEAFTAALKILGEGQLSLTKFLLITDQNCNIRDFKELFIKVLERADFRKDLYVLSNISQDTLDYTGPQVNKGSKAILMGIGEKTRELKTEWRGSFVNQAFSRTELFCPGVLCVQGEAYQLNPELARELAIEPAIRDFAMVFLLDDPVAACRSSSDFIWHVFTRFEPAADMVGNQFIKRMHIGFEGPVVVDCRMKPWYPEVLIDNPAVESAVLSKWGSMIDRRCKN
jgi:UbiD family decarboxylase